MALYLWPSIDNRSSINGKTAVLSVLTALRTFELCLYKSSEFNESERYFHRSQCFVKRTNKIKIHQIHLYISISLSFYVINCIYLYENKIERMAHTYNFEELLSGWRKNLPFPKRFDFCAIKLKMRKMELLQNDSNEAVMRSHFGVEQYLYNCRVEK